MLASFKLAFGLLRPGGVYLIEDVTKENVHAVKELLLGGYRYEDTRADLFHALYHNPGAPCCAFTPNAVQRDIEYVTEYPMMLAVRSYLGGSRDGYSVGADQPIIKTAWTT